jgi:hypothetical protein
MVDLKTGEFREFPRGSGKRLERSPNGRPPCHECPKISQGDKEKGNTRPEFANELSDLNQSLWELYRLWRTDRDGMIPMDELTLELFSYCQRIDEAINRSQQNKSLMEGIALWTVKSR